MRCTPPIRQVSLSSHVISFAPYAIHMIKTCELTVPSAGGRPVQQPPSYQPGYPLASGPSPPGFHIPVAGVSHAPVTQATQQDISMPRVVTGQLVNGDPPPHHNLYPPPSIPQVLGNRAPSEPDHLEGDEEPVKGRLTVPMAGRPRSNRRSEQFLSCRRL
jgi:hypothetical protein